MASAIRMIVQSGSSSSPRLGDAKIQQGRRYGGQRQDQPREEDLGDQAGITHQAGAGAGNDIVEQIPT